MNIELYTPEQLAIWETDADMNSALGEWKPHFATLAFTAGAIEGANKILEPLTDAEITQATGALPDTPLWLVAKGFVEATQMAMRKKAGL